MKRYNQKNIAQRFADRQAKKSNKIKSYKSVAVDLTKDSPKSNLASREVVAVSQSVQNAKECPGALWNDKLYPARLWHIHKDLDLLAYHSHKLSKKEKEKLFERLPANLVVAERQADRALYRFVENEVNKVGVDTYGAMLRKAMTPKSKILLALRCWIASAQQNRPRDGIIIYQNRSMNSADFFPESAKRIGIDPETKEEFVYYIEGDGINEEDDDPYTRSKVHQSQKHIKVREIKEPGPTKRDKLPGIMHHQMKLILEDFGHSVETTNQAWKILDKISKNSSIEDRIVARISYLIINATTHEKRGAIKSLTCYQGQSAKVNHDEA